MATTLTAADIRKIRPFEMEDEDLEAYGELVIGLDPFGVESSSAVSSDTKRKLLFSLLAAHAATMLREPEPVSVREGDMSVQWNQADCLSKESLRSTGPGKLFLSTWTRLNRGWILR